MTIFPLQFIAETDSPDLKINQVDIENIDTVNHTFSVEDDNQDEDMRSIEPEINTDVDNDIETVATLEEVNNGPKKIFDVPRCRSEDFNSGAWINCSTKSIEQVAELIHSQTDHFTIKQYLLEQCSSQIKANYHIRNLVPAIYQPKGCYVIDPKSIVLTLLAEKNTNH